MVDSSWVIVECDAEFLMADLGGRLGELPGSPRRAKVGDDGFHWGAAGFAAGQLLNQDRSVLVELTH
jgi:hypothetical protein